MATPTSATGGVLPPVPPLPIDDEALDAVFQSLVASITGLDGTLVRPRWQPVPPKQPPPATNWCAVAVVNVQPDAGPWIDYIAATNTSIEWDHEELTLLVSFYGPNAASFARLLRLGIAIPQNWESLTAQQIAYVTCDAIRKVPELVNQQWIIRQDLSLTFRRKVEMTYAVQNLLLADINLIDDTTVDDTIIVPPGSPWSP